MGFWIFLFFLVFPVAEVFVFGKVIARIGFWDTLALLVFSAILGLYLAKLQGKATLIRVQQALASGKLPTVEMIDGLMIFLGGVLFIIPGFISDLMGFFLIFPLTRWGLRGLLMQGIKVSDMSRGRREDNAQTKHSQGFSTHKGNAEDAQIVD